MAEAKDLTNIQYDFKTDRWVRLSRVYAVSRMMFIASETIRMKPSRRTAECWVEARWFLLFLSNGPLSSAFSLSSFSSRRSYRDMKPYMVSEEATRANDHTYSSNAGRGPVCVKYEGLGSCNSRHKSKLKAIQRDTCSGTIFLSKRRVNVLRIASIYPCHIK